MLPADVDAEVHCDIGVHAICECASSTGAFSQALPATDIRPGAHRRPCGGRARPSACRVSPTPT
jgi:hypothetical protein